MPTTPIFNPFLSVSGNPLLSANLVEQDSTRQFVSSSEKTDLANVRAKFSRLNDSGFRFIRQDRSIVGILGDDGSLRSRLLDFRGSISVNAAGQLKTTAIDFTKSLGELRGVAPLGMIKWRIDDQGNAFFRSVTTSDGVDLSGLTTLATRVDRTLDGYGIPKDGILWPERLRRVSAKCLMLARGQLAVISVTTCNTNSWFFRAGVLYRMRDILTAKYGSAGAGFIAFWEFSGDVSDYPAAQSVGSATAGQKRYSVSTTGTWTVDTNALTVCNTGGSSSEVGAQVIVSVSNTGETQNDIKLLYLPVSGAQVRWKVNSGAWTTIDLSSGVSAALAGASITDGDTLTLDVVAGTPNLTGLVALNGQDGFVFHKAARGGSTSADWAVVMDDANARAQLAVLNPDLNICGTATNDQGPAAGISPAQLNANYDSVITKMREAVPHTGEPPMDVLLVSPCENWAGRATPMADYDLEIRKAAYDNEAVFVSGQSLLGPLPASNYEDISDGSLHLTGAGYDYFTAGILRVFPMWS